MAGCPAILNQFMVQNDYGLSMGVIVGLLADPVALDIVIFNAQVLLPLVYVNSEPSLFTMLASIVPPAVVLFLSVANAV